MKILFALICICVVNGLHAQTISANQQQQDFEQIVDALKTYNVGLYELISEEEFDIHVQQFQQRFSEVQHLYEFYADLKQFIQPIGERHISLRGFHKQSDFAKRLKEKKPKYLPLSIKFANDSTAFIVRNVSQDSTIQLPSKLVAINNQTIGQIRNELANYITHDKDIETWTNWEISRVFPSIYRTIIDTTSTFQIDYVDSLGLKHSSEIKGVTSEFFKDSIKAQSLEILNVEEFKPSIRKEYYDSISTAYLKIGSFNTKKWKHNGEKFRFKPFIAEFFATANGKHTDNVIIDLRNNTGGKISYVFYLLSFIQPIDKIVLFDKTQKRLLSSDTFTKEISSYNAKKCIYNGNIYILTNGGSYSASVMFTTFAKQYANAIIVGEEAGGRYNGTTAGSFKTVRLNHSDIVVRVPRKLYRYQIVKDDLVSLQPDIEIKTKVEDYFSYENDNQLAELLNRIATQHDE